MYRLLEEKKVNLPPHPFATDWQAVLFRNYGTVKTLSIAKVLKTDEQTIEKEAVRLGLENVSYDPAWKEKGYVTIIKNNWYLLDYEGICTLTETTEELLAKTLYEDDFLFAKVGNFKPAVTSPFYAPLTEEQIAYTNAQARLVRENRPKERAAYFDFFKYVPKVDSGTQSDSLMMVYNYGELFGDNLLTGDFSAYSEEMLKSLSELGVNAIWKHVVLSDLVGLPFDETYGKGWEFRLENLKKLCDKLESYGIKLWLYMNEPRALPIAFFENRRDILGVHDGELGALCTSAPAVQEYLYESVKKLVCAAPKLGGLFTITSSENLTNCYSRSEYDAHTCLRCGKRTRAEVCAEVNEIFARAIRDSGTDVKLVAWTWGWAEYMGWSTEDTLKAVKSLSSDIGVMCVSEEALEIQADEGSFSLLDYSVSQVGPSERTKKVFETAKESGHKIYAKIQVNNSWECASVPYIPCFELVWKHLQNLKEQQVDGYMLSWSLGGYPSFNLSLVAHAQKGGTLEEWYRKTFGADGERVRVASERFSDAFEQLPFGISLLYCGPQNVGCANPFYDEPTGLQATMVGFPFDNLDVWRGAWSTEKYLDKLRALTELWREGLACLDCVTEYNATCLRRVAQATYCQFYSAYLQSKWIAERDKTTIEKEFENTKRLIKLSAEDPTLGFEACNHYFYTENTLLEKLLTLDRLSRKVNA